jgi:hypothetical protein
VKLPELSTKQFVWKWVQRLRLLQVVAVLLADAHLEVELLAGVLQAEEPQVDAQPVEEPQVDALLVEEPRVDVLQVEELRAEEPQVDAQPVEELQVDALPVEELQVDVLQAVEPRVEELQADVPQVEEPQADAQLNHCSGCFVYDRFSTEKNTIPNGVVFFFFTR